MLMSWLPPGLIPDQIRVRLIVKDDEPNYSVGSRRWHE